MGRHKWSRYVMSMSLSEDFVKCDRCGLVVKRSHARRGMGRCIVSSPVQSEVKE